MFLFHKLTASMLVITFFFMPLVSLSADTVYMKSGRRYYGRIEGQTPKSVLIRTERKRITLNKRKIRKITYETLEDSSKRRKKDLRRLRRLRRKLREKRRKEARERMLREIAAARLAYLQQQAKYRAARAARLRKLVAEKKIEKPKDEPISFVDFAWRSAVLPGWGHVHIKRKYIGWAYTGTFLLLLYNAADKYRIGIAAKSQNDQDVLFNTVLAILPQSVPQAARFSYAVESNRLASGPQSSKVDSYHKALFYLAAFYGVQLVHIILNGILWENGGVLVQKGPDTSRPLEFDFALAPELDTAPGASSGKTRLAGEFRFTYRF